jgi:hypothetical protein
MWSLDDFKKFLDRKYNSSTNRSMGKGDDIWSEDLLPQLKDIIKVSILSAWDKIEWR